ncbi:MAG TPA: hypothetical protein VNO50_10810 [Pyrinomonadaceae bacterium]|nr:hypothetical protein [Pyrinomonadaceae bacterium]
MKAYKTVIRKSEDSYLSINRLLEGEESVWVLRVTRKASGGSNDHGNWLFAYPSKFSALSYATTYAPNGEVVLLECEVDGEKRDGKLYCRSVTPLCEIPVRRSGRKPAPTKIAGTHAPIKYVPGNQSPVETGEGYCWVSPTGNEWRGSSAPKWPYSKTYQYQSSTRRIEVGSDWSSLEIDRDAIYSTDL